MRSAGDVFAAERARLRAHAFRMTGCVADADDLVSESYLRFERHFASIENPAAWLTTTVTRLAIDHLTSARVRRETYIGPWLPEPVAEQSASASELAQEVSYALLVALETLSPLERAAFLLREVFAYDYPELAATLERDEAAVRQLCARARAHVQDGRPRFPVAAQSHAQLVAAFTQAVVARDARAFAQLLTADVRLVSDGGGKRSAAMQPVHGVDRVTKLVFGLANKAEGSVVASMATVGTWPAIVICGPDAAIEAVYVLGYDLKGDAATISDIWVMRNPDKLAHVDR